jgi:putative NADH-flavin reductase
MKGHRVRILLLGATGPTGRLFAEAALAHGHAITALVRDPARLRPAENPRLCVTIGDISDASSLATAMAGHDAVVSLAGTRSRLGDVRLYSDSTRAVLEAMSRSGVRRLVTASAAGVGGTRNAAVPGFFRAVVLPLLAGREYDDMARMEALLAASDVEWTAVKPLWLRNGPARGGVRVSAEPFEPHGWGIRRADLAETIVELVETGSHVRERVWVAYRAPAPTGSVAR